MMDIALTSTEFLALLKKFSFGELAWNDTNERLTLTVVFDTFTCRYLAPGPADMKIKAYVFFLKNVEEIRKSLPEFVIQEPKKKRPLHTMTPGEFLEKFKNLDARSVSTDADNLRLVIYESVDDGLDEDDDTPCPVDMFFGPDPAEIDFVTYMKFLGEIYKHKDFKDFVYAYIFSRLKVR